MVKIDKLKKLLNKITKKDKWKIYLYLKGQCIAVVYRDNDATPLNEIFNIKVRGLKHLIGTNKKMQILVKPYAFKFANNDIKEVHLECVIYEGVKIEND